MLGTGSNREVDNTEEIALNADDLIILNQEQYITTDPPNLNSVFGLKKNNSSHTIIAVQLKINY